MKKFGLLFLLITTTSFAQSLLLEENFNYGNTANDLVTASSSIWSTHSGSTLTDDVQYLTSGLSYAGYPSSGIGGSAGVLNSRSGDDNRTFSPQTFGSVYLSALVNISSATTAISGEYFLHFGANSNQYAKLYVRNSSSNLQFGLAKLSEGATFSSTNFSFNSTYLIVVKYTFLSGAQDDRVDLWVLISGVPSYEIAAGTATVENVTAANDDASSLSSFSLREGGNSYSATVDGIRISDSWSQAPLPVELTSFSASVVSNAVKLNWRTETEVNNYGFEVERKVGGLHSIIGNWEKLGFVNGNGNSNSPKSYSFEDKNVNTGKYSYRLKQIDNDGQFEYSKTIEVDFGTPGKFELAQNFPNPFNPETEIRFTLPAASSVKLTVFNLLGQEVKLLVNEYKEAGTHIINFNASDFNSGVYIYRLETNGVTQTHKMTLVK